MKKYEYKVVQCEVSKWGMIKMENLELQLTEEGMNGWRYKDQIASGSGKKYVILERQVSGFEQPEVKIDQLV